MEYLVHGLKLSGPSSQGNTITPSSSSDDGSHSPTQQQQQHEQGQQQLREQHVHQEQLQGQQMDGSSSSTPMSIKRTSSKRSLSVSDGSTSTSGPKDHRSPPKKDTASLLASSESQSPSSSSSSSTPNISSPSIPIQSKTTTLFSFSSSSIETHPSASSSSSSSSSTFVSARVALSTSGPCSSHRFAAGGTMSGYTRPVYTTQNTSRSLSPGHQRHVHLTPQEKRAIRVCGGGTGPLLGKSEIPEGDPKMSDVSFWLPYLHNIFRQNGIVPIDFESPAPSPPTSRRGSKEESYSAFAPAEYGSLEEHSPMHSDHSAGSGSGSKSGSHSGSHDASNRNPRVEDLHVKAVPGTYPVFLVPNARMSSRYEMVDNDSRLETNNGLVVKFFGKNFNGDKGHTVELAVYKLLRQAEYGPIGPRVPNLKAYGCLFVDEDKAKLTPEQQETFWSWPWIITTIIPGTSWGYLRGYTEREDPPPVHLALPRPVQSVMDPGAKALSLLSFKEETDLAGQLGALMHLLHMMPIDEVLEKGPSHPFSRNGPRGSFISFLQRRRTKAPNSHRRRGSLPPKLIDQIDAYLPHDMTSLLPPVASLRDPPNTALTTLERPICLIHADIHGDHVMLRRNDTHYSPLTRRGSSDLLEHSSSESANWYIEGIIDFGDARLGHPIYELTSIHTELLRSDKRLLRAYLEGYGWQMPMISVGALTEEEGVDTPVGHSFVYLAMCHSLLHHQDLFKNVFRRHPEMYNKFETLHELAEWLWNFEQV